MLKLTVSKQDCVKNQDHILVRVDKSVDLATFSIVSVRYCFIILFSEIGIESIILQVVSVSAQTLLVRYIFIFYEKLKFLNNVHFIIKANVHASCICSYNRFRLYHLALVSYS